MKINLAISLTLSRILFIPLIIFFYLFPDGEYRNYSAYFFLLALISDYLDGVVARNLNQVTAFGEFLDPIADKLLVVITILLLAQSISSLYFLIPSIIIISREFLVIAIRQRLAEIRGKVSLRVTNISKIKTSFQMISLFFLLHHDISIDFISLHLVGIFLLCVAAILTVISFIYYVRNSWNDIIR